MVAPTPPPTLEGAARPAPTSPAELFALYERNGQCRYGEDVTVLEHALQCAALAVADGATDELVVAALFHDVGWLVGGETVDDARGADHAADGARVLEPLFGTAVAQPVALHVTAKRWRCTIDPDYYDELSEGSRITFVAQGGPLGTDERAAFEAHPGFVTAMALRSWDDRAKVRGHGVAGLDHYRQTADALARRHRPSGQ